MFIVNGFTNSKTTVYLLYPGDKFGTVVGENPTPCVILALCVGCQLVSHRPFNAQLWFKFEDFIFV